MSLNLRDRVIIAPRYHLDERTIATMTGIARRSRPYEACGILCPPCLEPGPEHYPSCDRVKELPNRALELLATGPDQAYAMDSESIHQTMMAWIKDHPVTWESFTPELLKTGEEMWGHFSVWHTHPTGGAGPSHKDLLGVVPGFSYLVASLHAHPGGSSVNFTWF